MKQINGLMGFCHDDVLFEKMDVVVEIDTNGTDADGYELQETIGVARSNASTSVVLFRGSNEESLCIASTLIFSEENDTMSMVSLLRELADELEKANE